MSIELDRDKERVMVKTAIQREIVLARSGGGNLAAHLSGIITEALFETAAMTVLKGPEAGIKAGRELIRKWSD